MVYRRSCNTTIKRRPEYEVLIQSWLTEHEISTLLINYTITEIANGRMDNGKWIPIDIYILIRD